MQLVGQIVTCLSDKICSRRSSGPSLLKPNLQCTVAASFWVHVCVDESSDQAHWDFIFQGQGYSNGWKETHGHLWFTKDFELNIGETVQLVGDFRRQQQPHDPLTHQQDRSGEGEQFQTPAPGVGRPGSRGSLESHLTPATACSSCWDQGNGLAAWWPKQTDSGGASFPGYEPSEPGGVSLSAKLYCHRYKRSDSLDAFLGSPSL